MTERTYVTSDNVSTFCKVQSATGFADRGEVILAWDDFDSSQKKLAKNIDIDELKVRTTDPRSVPNKWKDNIVEEDSDPDAVDFIKQIIANPARHDVYQLLKDYDPPEPLILWWIDKTFTDDEYFNKLAAACRYGLFKGDNRYLWAVVAFGVDAGVGRFHWPDSEKDPAAKKSIKQKLVDKYDVRPKEVDVLWDDVSEFVADEIELTEEEAQFLGTTRSESGDGESTASTDSSMSGEDVDDGSDREADSTSLLDL